MAPATDQKRAGLTEILVVVLIVTLLAGALLVRLVGDEQPPVSPATAESNATVIAGEDGSDDYSGPPLQGRPAPDFTLPDLDGQPVSLSDWRGHPVLVNFWATWCGPCEVEMPALQAAYEAHRDDDLVVLAVAVEDSVENARRFFEERGLSFQAVMDDGEVSRAYQVFGLPTSFFVGPGGEVVAVHRGLLTADVIEDYLARALAQD